MRQSRWVAVLAAGLVFSPGLLVLASDEGDVAALVNAAASTQAEKLRQGRLSYQLDQVANAHEQGRALYDRGSRPRWVDAETGQITAIVELREGFGPGDLSRAVAEAGGAIEGSALELVKVKLPAAGLRTLAADPAARIVRTPHYAQPKDVVSQGVKVMKADQFISRTGDDGTGVTVAIMDAASFGGSRQLIGSELPSDTAATPFVQNGTFTEVHGTACAEVIHDVAPGAKLVLGGFRGDEVAWAEQIDLLVGMGVDVISHSLGFDNIAAPNGKHFFARVADSVNARGVLFVTAAGNEAQRYNTSTWSDKNRNNLLEFKGQTENVRIYAETGAYVILRWDDAFGHSNHDYDLYVKDGGGNIVGKSEGLQSGGQDPLEGVDIPNGIAEILTVSVRHDPSSPSKSNQKLYLYVGGPSQLDPAYQTKASTLTLPADAKGALAVGAVRYSNKKLEAFSSQGPTADNRVKPDLTAPDGVVTVSYGDPFYGTSAATPHAAGAAALILSHNPNLSVSALRTALQKATASSGNSRNNQQGYGLIDLSKAK